MSCPDVLAGHSFFFGVDGLLLVVTRSAFSPLEAEMI